jgi:predicted nucleic acid-binding protein
MSTFADSSALVKLYADEPQHQLIREFPVLVVSQLARVEVPAALWRRHRMGKFSAVTARRLVNHFETDYYGSTNDDELPRFAVVTASEPVLDAAARFCATHGLRAYHAVQLASAHLAAATDPECTTFAAFDGALRDAAAAEGFTLLP